MEYVKYFLLVLIAFVCLLVLGHFVIYAFSQALHEAGNRCECATAQQGALVWRYDGTVLEVYTVCKNGENCRLVSATS